MNKFGIFNLLNSFFDNYANKNSENLENPEASKSTENPFSQLLSSLKNSDDKQPATKTKQPPKPLTSQLLNTMHSHDAFVKRVTLNSTKK